MTINAEPGAMLLHEQCGEQLILLCERAIYRPRARQLLIADVHLGKAATFRSFGVPIPSGTTDATLERLTRLLQKTGAAELVVLGDFFHAACGVTPEILQRLHAWREQHHDLQVTLIRGNHDLQTGDPPADLRFDCRDEGVPDGPFVWRHIPGADPRGYVLAGHWHPAAALRGTVGSERPACFWFGAELAVLPAFGEFTGKRNIEPTTGDALYVVGPDCVLPVRIESITHRRSGRKPRSTDPAE